MKTFGSMASRLARQLGRGTADRPADLLEKRLAQRHDVGRAGTQRWKLDVEDTETVKEILAKLAARARADHRYPGVAAGDMFHDRLIIAQTGDVDSIAPPRAA